MRYQKSLFVIYNSTNMASEMTLLQLIKPETFNEDRDTINVDDFLDTLELTFPNWSVRS